MKVAIMQPYLFPYLGYFQLINAVDIFVVYDDVQFIKNGWINRNRIRINGGASLFSFGVKKDSTFKHINDRYFSNRYEQDKIDFMRSIECSYKKAPLYQDVHNLISEIFKYKEANVARVVNRSLKNICEYLNIKTKLVLSSDIEKNNDLKAQEKVIDICKHIGGTTYINAIGGRNLYSKEKFHEAGINLFFINSLDINYEFPPADSIPGLSIIDVLMYNSKEYMKSLLDQYSLI